VVLQTGTYLVYPPFGETQPRLTELRFALEPKLRWTATETAGGQSLRPACPTQLLTAEASIASGGQKKKRTIR
jgi:hypothetical protein